LLIIKKEDTPIFVLFGIYYLREQLHAYIEVLESQTFHVARLLGGDSAKRLLVQKQNLLNGSSRFFSQLRYADIDDPDLFNPPEMVWISVTDIENCALQEELVLYLMKYDESLMKWCYWFLSEEDINLEISRYFYEVIKSCKEDVELLSEMH